jgi:hypothetical protein
MISVCAASNTQVMCLWFNRPRNRDHRSVPGISLPGTGAIPFRGLMKFRDKVEWKVKILEISTG